MLNWMNKRRRVKNWKHFYWLWLLVWPLMITIAFALTQSRPADLPQELPTGSLLWALVPKSPWDIVPKHFDLMFHVAVPLIFAGIIACWVTMRPIDEVAESDA